MDKQTRKEQAIAAAKKYVEQQLATMKEHGSAPKLTRAEREELVRKVAAASM